jgi:hypothetical protein
MPAIYNPPIQVVGFVGTRKGDADRGPAIRLSPYEASIRMLHDNEYVWVYGPRRHDLAVVIIDDAVPRGGIIARDISGIATSEIVTLVRVHGDRSIITAEHA